MLEVVNFTWELTEKGSTEGCTPLDNFSIKV